MKYKFGLFLFHRDFRLKDNIGLLEASKLCEHVYTAFIFTPEQVSRSNDFKSKNSVQFMIQSLEDLEDDLKKHRGKLIIQYGSYETVLRNLLKTLSIECLFFNYDLTPYARQRTRKAEELCNGLNVDCVYSHDYYLHEPGAIMTGNDTMYHKFTPYYEKALVEKEIDTPNNRRITNFAERRTDFDHSITLKEAMEKFVGKENPFLHVIGGRALGKKQLTNALKSLGDYAKTRDIMSIETSSLSAYIKFGCVSIREVYERFARKYGKFHELVRQLIWRDFYAHLLYFYPQSLGQLHSEKMKELDWSNSRSRLEAWKRGETGVPLVDAGMRQMNETGYMHNRVRMLVATYLTKILHINWLEGEKYFAQKLVDYDVASNSGNWQAVVGGGVYAMPWFRVMSPWAQSEQYDHDCIYIKTWVEELANLEPKVIHKWYKYCKTSEYNNIYKCPIVEYKEEKAVFMKMMS